MSARRGFVPWALRWLLVLVVPVVLVASGGVAAAQQAPDDQRPSADQVAREYFTDLPLVTQDGEEVRFYSDVLAGRVVLISSFYTECQGVSPRQAEVLAGLQEMLGEQMGRDVLFVSITVDPATDTPEVVRDYAREVGAGPGWIFLTGKPENVDWINHRLGNYLEELEDHHGVYLLGNLRTTLWKKAPAHAMAIDLYREVQILLQDEGEDDSTQDRPASAPADPGDPSLLTAAEARGRDIYMTGTSPSSPSGAEITALLGANDLELPGEAARCGSCHGHDGTGRPEGGVLPSNITWAHTTRSYGHIHDGGVEHPPFDETSLVRYLRTGTFPGGAAGDPSMPRYRIADEDARDLVAFLRRLGSLPDPGVGEQTLRLGTLVPLGAQAGGLGEIGRAIVEVLEAAFDSINQAGGIYGRRLELVVGDSGAISDAAAVRAWLAAERPFALVSPVLPSSEVEVYEALAEEDLSVIGPLALESIRSFSLSRNVYHLLPGLAEQVDALLRYASSDLGLGRLPAAVLYPATESASPELVERISEAASRLGWPALREVPFPAPGESSREAVRALRDDSVEVIVSLGVEGDLRGLLDAAVEEGWQPWVLAPGVLSGALAFDAPREVRRRFVLSYPTVPRDRDPQMLEELATLLEGRETAARHGQVTVATYCAAAVLVEALRRSGKDLDRRHLADRLDGLYRFETGLMPPITFTANRRVGSRGAYVLRADALAESGRAPAGTWIDLDRPRSTSIDLGRPASPTEPEERASGDGLPRPREPDMAGPPAHGERGP